MDLNTLKMFIAIVQAGTFAGGSQRLGIPIATLSRKIRELESALNVQLLERSTQGIKPTLVGLQLFEQASQSIETLGEIERLIKGNQQSLKGKLRLSMPQSFTLLWDMLADFQTAYPNIDIHMLATNRKIDLLEEGIDVAVRVGELETDTLIAKHLFNLQLMLVASPAFLAQHPTLTSPNDLHNLPCIAWSPTAEKSVKWQLGGKLNQITPHFASNDYHHLKHLLLNGKGIGDLPDFLAKPLIEEGKLIQLLPDFPFPKQAVHLLYPSHRFPSSIVKAYVDFCVGWCKGR